MANVLDIVKQLRKDYKNDNLILKGDVVPHYKKLPTNALGLDYPLFGGLPLGRVITFAGLQASGKTTASFLAMSAYQKAYPDKMCVFVDVEHCVDLNFQAKMTGVDLSNLLVVTPDLMSGQDILNMILRLEQDSDNIGMIVIDSVASLQTAESLEKDLDVDPGMRGSVAKTLHRFLKTMVTLVAEKNNILLCINQVQIAGKTFTGAPIYVEPTGCALDYYSSLKLRFGKRTFIKDDKVDCSDAEDSDGFRLKFAITKSKVGPMTRGGGFVSFNYDKGQLWLDDMFEIACKFDFIKRLNNITYQLVDLDTNEVLKEGKKSDLQEFIKSDIEFQNKYIKMLGNHISGDNTKSYGDILDEEDKNVIKEQEAIIEMDNSKKKKKEYLVENRNN